MGIMLGTGGIQWSGNVVALPFSGASGRFPDLRLRPIHGGGGRFPSLARRAQDTACGRFPSLVRGTRGG